MSETSLSTPLATPLATPLPTPLPPAQLYRPADLSALPFETTAELVPSAALARPTLIGQSRAQDALRLGTEIVNGGFNTFAIGASSARIQQTVRTTLEDAARGRPAPEDWVYVNNFTTPHRPTAIALPTGRAPAFQRAMRHLIEDLQAAIPSAFESEDYQTRRSAIEDVFRSKNEQAFSALGDRAGARGLVIARTPMGFAVAPSKDGQVMPPEEFNALPEEKRREIQQASLETEKELEMTLRSIPRLEKERRDAVRTLNRETARFAVTQPIEEARAPFADVPKILEHLEAVRADLLDNVHLFVGPQAPGEQAPIPMPMRPGGPFDRYEVNVLVTQDRASAQAPVVEELHPTLGNLLGRIEYLSEQGTLVTNFRLIKAGALHRANGGTILIDARSLLMEPFSWSALKRVLVRQRIDIEDVARFIGFTSTVSLEPDPIPLHIKIVLFGDRQLYYLLVRLDPEFSQHFKVLADFDDDVTRTPTSEAAIARLIAALAAERGLLPINRDGVMRVVEHAARLAGDAEKLTLLVEHIHDLLAEAGHHAGQTGRAVTTRADIDTAIAQQIRRASRIHERSREMILRDIALVDTTGSSVGQINGLAVFALGGYAFGSPSRITCRVRPGTGRIVDIEREVELGGPLHSKGVLILSGFLSGRYALEAPMSLYASLVFEQSYSEVEGDSASSTELYALLSALGEVPLRQDLAVTGSVNQHGVVQAIGGVNEKIEGFFDVCQARGLTGTQGVLIPQANAQHLMLRADVVAACAAGQFFVYPIRTIDEGIALLTGLPAGVRGADGTYPEGSVNRRVENTLARFTQARRSLGTERVPGGGEIS